MINLSDINQIKKILTAHGFSFSKAMGQNFIIDETVCPEMAEASVPSPEYGVIEIGPGIGVLTAELAKRASKVVAIELDKRLLPILADTLADFDNVKIINSDVLKIDLKKLIEDEFDGMPVTVCANLPYYITSPIIMSLLEARLPIESLTVMVQAEAADRLCATVGTRAAGAVTVAVNYYSEAEELFFVPRTSFLPAPKVDSKVIKLRLRDNSELNISDDAAFFNMVKTAFTKRRKTILNSLPYEKSDISRVLKELDIAESSRIEQLTDTELIEIFKKLG